MTTDDEITQEAKQNLRQGVPDIVDLHEELSIVETDEERRHILAVIAKMQQLISHGYQPEPMPELSKPARLESGDLRFLAKRCHAPASGGSFSQPSGGRLGLFQRPGR